MWTRAPSVTSCCVVALDHPEAEVGGASPRFHHRGVSSSSNHQPGEQELLLLQDTPPPTTKPLDFHTLDAPTTTIHHDLPKPPGSSKRLPSPRGGSYLSETVCKLSPMSTPELDSVVVARVRQYLQPPPVAKTTRSVNCVRKEKPLKLDDMQTVQIANAHTTIPASSSSTNSDQEVPEVVLQSPSKRRRLVYNHEPELNTVGPPSEALSPEGCEDSGLTGEQHMADLDRSPSKSSIPEDIDSATHVTSTSELATRVPVSVPQCDTSQQVVEQENYIVVDQVILPSEPLQIVEEHLQHSSSSLQQTVVVPATSSPGDDDTQHSTSQFLPPAGHVWVPNNSRISHTVTQTMAGGGDEWLRLSLGSSHGGQSDDEPPAATVPLELHQQSRPIQHDPPRSSTTTPDPPTGIRDFFSFAPGTSEEATSSSHRHSGESSKQHYNYPEPSSTHPRAGILPRPLFLEPRPRASRDSTWLDPNVHTPRVLSDPFTLSPAVSSLRGSFSPQQFSNLSSLPYHPARVLQPVRSEPTDTTSVHAWRSAQYEAGPSSGPAQYASGAPYWMQQPQLQDPQRTSPNAAEFLSMATPGAAFRDRSFLSMQLPLAQGVDPEQAWRNLLQRVGNNMNVPGGQRPGAPESTMLPPGEREEYLDLKRAVERFQGADQGGKEEPLTDLQRLHRSAPMFPPGQQQRPYPAGLPAFDPSTDISLASRFYSAPLSSSSSRARASAVAAGPAPSSERQRRIQLRPHAPQPGLWFTLQASNSQPERPEASPLQQIPTAYIRVVDDTMTVAAVRRYLANKLGLASEDEVELTCRGQPLQHSISLHQVRDGIWQSPNTNTPTPNTPQLLSEGKAWKAPDGSITLVGDVVMVLTYDRRPQQAQAQTPTST